MDSNFVATPGYNNKTSSRKILNIIQIIAIIIFIFSLMKYESDNLE